MFKEKLEKYNNDIETEEKILALFKRKKNILIL